MPILERYILRRATRVFLLTLGAFVAALWITEVLRELDVVTAKGQAIWVFLLVTILGLPPLLQIIAPIAYLAATIVTLTGLNNDSELAVMSAAGASRRAVYRPILTLGIAVTLAVALSHHVLAPASLAALRGLVTRVGADVIATVVKDGGFRTVADGLTIHIRARAPDGSFHGIFVSDERDPMQSIDYSAAQGMLLERAGGSFLVLQKGHLVREDRLQKTDNVVQFETYALDLSQLTASNAAAFYKARERSTAYLLEPEPNDTFTTQFPDRVTIELHDRVTAPLYTLAFGLIALAYLGRPRTNRQDRNYAIASAVLISLLLRAAGFAALAAGNGTLAVVPVLYLVPLGGIAFGLWGVMRSAGLRTPEAVQTGIASLVAAIAALVLRRPAEVRP